MGACVSIERAADEPTAVMYGATWCAWSQKMAAELGGNARVVWCDKRAELSENDAAVCATVDAYPTLLLPGGRRLVGYHPAALVQTELQKIRSQR